jgi:hypothetical protein
MLKWIVVLLIAAAAWHFGPRLYERFAASASAEGCRVALRHDEASPGGGRFVAHYERQECSGQDPQIRMWVALTGQPRTREMVFSGKASQFLPDFDRPEDIRVTSAWSDTDTLTIHLPEGTSYTGNPGRLGMGVEVVYSEYARRR